MPAAAVTQTVQALFGFIGRKGYVDGLLNFIQNARVITLDSDVTIIRLK